MKVCKEGGFPQYLRVCKKGGFFCENWRFRRGRFARLEGSGVLWGGLGEILGAALGAQEGQKSSTFTEARKSQRFLAKKKIVEGKLIVRKEACSSRVEGL